MNGDVLEDVPGSPRLSVRRWRSGGEPVLYVHGATFPSALSVGYRFDDGESWASALLAAGFEPWALDFAGYGDSERPAALDMDAAEAPLVGEAADATAQIARAVAHITAARSGARVHVIAHSWGSIPAAAFAASAPDAVGRLVLFGPILKRDAPADEAPPLPGWRLITVEEQRVRFEQDTPASHGSVLAEPDLSRWGRTWLETDPRARARTPPSVQVPNGPASDLRRMWRGVWLYDPASIEAPTLVVRGEWDSLCTDQDVAGFFAKSGGRARWDARLPRGGHLMHLETGRRALWGATNAFLSCAP